MSNLDASFYQAICFGPDLSAWDREKLIIIGLIHRINVRLQARYGLLSDIEKDDARNIKRRLEFSEAAVIHVSLETPVLSERLRDLLSEAFTQAGWTRVDFELALPGDEDDEPVPERLLKIMHGEIKPIDDDLRRPLAGNWFIVLEKE